MILSGAVQQLAAGVFTFALQGKDWNGQVKFGNGGFYGGPESPHHNAEAALRGWALVQSRQTMPCALPGAVVLHNIRLQLRTAESISRAA